VADFIGSIFLWPQVLAQISLYDHAFAIKLDKRGATYNFGHEDEADA
jgi:hypothetical protein